MRSTITVGGGRSPFPFGFQIQAPSMKPSQLGSVLVKVLGLWMCVQGVAPFVAGLLRGLLSINERSRGALELEFTYAVGSGAHLVVGVLFIIAGSRIARLLFKRDDQ